MRTKSQDKTKSISLKKKLAELKINNIAVQTGFQSRRPKKISAFCLITGFFDSCFGNRFSLSTWAFQVGILASETVSKQGISSRITERFIDLLKVLIGDSFGRNIGSGKNKMLKRFTNVYVQDSSCLALPDSLKNNFKGNYSRGEIKAVAKLQVIFNITQGFFSSLALTPYSTNDQAAAKEIICILKKGDLVIRDMGYFVVNALLEIVERKAHFITRLKANVSLFDAKTQEKIYLSRILRNRTFLKRKVLLGTEVKIPVILMAIKTSNRTWNQRKHKMLKDRDKRKKITIEKLNMAGWDIFVTSVDDLTGKEIKEVYRVRWQIEIIFKSWKSHLNLENNISKHLKKPQLFCAVVYLTLLMVVLIIMPIYNVILAKLKDQTSILRLTQMLLIIIPKENWHLKSREIERLAYYSRYARRKRQNMAQKLQILT